MLGLRSIQKLTSCDEYLKSILSAGVYNRIADNNNNDDDNNNNKDNNNTKWKTFQFFPTVWQ